MIHLLIQYWNLNILKSSFEVKINDNYETNHSFAQQVMIIKAILNEYHQHQQLSTMLNVEFLWFGNNPHWALKNEVIKTLLVSILVNRHNIQSKSILMFSNLKETFGKIINCWVTRQDKGSLWTYQFNGFYSTSI